MHPANPLDRALRRLERDFSIRSPAMRLYEATGRSLMPGRISILRRPIDPAREQRPGIPGPETRQVLHQALLALAPDAGGLPPEAWDEFAAALRLVRAGSDRRRSEVRDRK